METSEKYTAKGRPVYSMRLATTERRIMEAAASLHDEPLSTYIRRVALARARRELAEDGADR